MMHYLMKSLKGQAFLSGIWCYCTAVPDCTTHRRPIEIFFTDHIGRPGADLSARQYPVPDQANDRHAADAETARGFTQDELVSLFPFALAIDCNLVCAAEVADSQLSPAMSSG